MTWFDGMEFMGRERQEALLAEAEKLRRARASREPGRWTRMRARWLSYQHPSGHARRRQAEWAGGFSGRSAKRSDVRRPLAADDALTAAHAEDANVARPTSTCTQPPEAPRLGITWL